MTPRSIRRAAERRAAKLARKAGHALNNTESAVALESSAEPEIPAFADVPEPETAEIFAEPPTEAPAPNRAISDAQLQANRRNSQLSSGPTSSTGKAKVSRNAVKTALTGRTVLLPSDDAAEYELHLEGYYDDFRPVGQLECDLVRAIADAGWRQLRIPMLEMALFAKGHIEFAEEFSDCDPRRRAGLIDCRTFIAYEKQFRNLQLQEARLHRRREKDLAELRRLQEERKANEEQAEEAASTATKHAGAHSENGFEFSNAPIDDGYVDLCSPETIRRALARSGLTSSQAA